MTWGPEDERRHPRDREGQWAEKLSARLPGGSIYDTLIDPEFGDPSEQMQQQAETWAREHFDYTDRTSGVYSRVSSVEHGGDGFSVNGRFEDQSRTVGTWSIGVLAHGGRDEATRAFAVEEINLDRDYQGQGIAGRWARRLEQVARDTGTRHISMWDMSGGFWERMGYTRDRHGIGEKQL